MQNIGKSLLGFDIFVTILRASRSKMPRLIANIALLRILAFMCGVMIATRILAFTTPTFITLSFTLVLALAV